MKKRDKENKLRETRGASIIMALVYFLICATAGAAVLASALAGVSHLKAQKRNESSYLAVMSAGELMKRRLKASEGDWSVINDEDLPSPAEEGDRAGYKAEMGEAVSGGFPPSSLESFFSKNMYQVYLNCIKDDNSWRDLSTEQAREGLSESLVLTLELDSDRPDGAGVPKAEARITMVPDYVVMDSGDVQQLQVRLQADISLEAEGVRQYSLQMTAGGVVYYMLEEVIDQEEISSANPDTGEEETETVYHYSYTSHAALSWDKPVFSPGPRGTAEVKGL